MAPPAPVASIEISLPSSEIVAGDSMRLSATPKDADGQPLTDRPVLWSSNNPFVATVDPDGLLTAFGPGRARITATAEGTTAVTGVTVLPIPVASVSVTPDTAVLQVGEPRQFLAALRDAAGNALRDRVVEWSSSDSTRARVSTTGLVTPLAPGEVTITARSEGRSAQSRVAIRPAAIHTLRIEPPVTLVPVGGAARLTVEILDRSGNRLERPVSYRSSDSTVAAVDPTGLVRGVAVGSATVTASSEERSTTAVVLVTPPPVASLALEPAAATVREGESVQLQAVARDAEGRTITGAQVSYTSSAPSVATVSASGLVQGVAPGQATITAASGGRSASTIITVRGAEPSEPHVAFITIDPAAASTFVKFSVQLRATARSASGNVVSVPTTWASLDPEIASVDAQGVVTGRAVGQARIGVTAGGKSATATVTVGPEPTTVIEKVSGDLQVDTVTKTLAQPLVVRVLNASGQPAVGVVVTWAGDGVVDPAQTVTDENGMASVRWRLGTRAGTYTVRASTATPTGALSVQFQATARPSAPHTYSFVRVEEVQVSPTSVRSIIPGGRTLPVRVRIVDRYGNPVPDEVVGFAVGADDGSIDASAVTDAEGVATVSWTAPPLTSTPYYYMKGTGVDLFDAPRYDLTVTFPFANDSRHFVLYGGLGRLQSVDFLEDMTLQVGQTHTIVNEFTVTDVYGTVGRVAPRGWISTNDSVAVAWDNSRSSGHPPPQAYVQARAAGTTEIATNFLDQLYPRFRLTVVPQ